MAGFFEEVFSSSFFMPHGHCYLWRPGLVWLQVLSNGVIASSYVAISITLAYLVYRLRDEIPFKTMYLAFGAFIVLCGLTHVFDVYVIWKPLYWVDGGVRAVTAAVSAGTALLLPGLVPHAGVLARGARTVRDRGIELETAVRDLETMYQRTRELDELKSQFFANVSHELRTPLALIIGPVEKHLGSETLTAEQRRDLQIVLRNARTLHKHVEDLLDAARLEAHKMKPDYAETDVAQLVRLAAANFEGLAEERRIDYRIDVPASVWGQVDPDKLQRILLNLLSNAFKFTPTSGHIGCTVTVTNEDGAPRAAAERRVVISVSDSGPGIPVDQREVVFERFRQLDRGAARKVGGTGLGLSIVKDFVALHAGTISVGEAPQGGCLFTVDLPLVAPSGVEVRTAGTETSKQGAELARQGSSSFGPRARRMSERSEESGANTNARRMSERSEESGANTNARRTSERSEESGANTVESIPSAYDDDKPLVLVVEDNPDMNRFVCETLSLEFRTERAFDGPSGLSKAVSQHPDLVLTDVMMPGMAGDELVRELRAHPELADVPIVLLTAKADDDMRIKLLREGAQDYVTKPFAAEELRARVGNLITLKRARDVLQEAKATAEAANGELEAFNYSVSHDLRAPLRGLDGFSLALLEDYGDRLEPQGKEYLQRIRAAAQRMAKLIDVLLGLSRVTRAEIHPARVDLSTIARGILERLQEGDRDRKVDVLLSDDLATLGDPHLLQVALENLLDNAWKFTQKRPGARIEFGRLQQNGVPVFYVRDNGAGFDMAYADKLFGAFQRLHHEKEFKGIGIGLATVQRIIARHGGRVWAEAAVNEGATFYFTLPLMRGRPSARP